MYVDGNPPRRINGSEANPAAGNNRYQDYSRSTVVIRCSMYKEKHQELERPCEFHERMVGEFNQKKISRKHAGICVWGVWQ